MKTDVLILGGGLSGWMAARQALSAGLDVLMVQDGQGASPWVHGFNHPVRQGDSAEVFLRDTMASGQGLSDPALAEALCQDSGLVFDELEAMGLSFNRQADGAYQAIRPLGASFPRVVSIGNETGVAILQRLKEMYGDRLQQLADARALQLLKRGDRVCGAVVYHRPSGQFLTIAARAVVLCTGGFCGIYPLTTNKRDSGGDGMAMALEAGASLCDMEFVQFEPSAALWPPQLNGTSMITTLFYEGAVLRNRLGERFMLRYGPDGERVGKDVLAYCIAQEVADGLGSPHGGVYMDCTAVPAEKLERDYPMYLERYRQVGIDLRTQPIELGPAPHTSLGGICIQADCATALPGLFACGEVIGGLHGANRIGGSAGLETLVFGRRAGQSAAAYAKSADFCQPDAPVLPSAGVTSAAEELTALRVSMQQCLQESAGVIRSGALLREALTVLQQLQDRAEALQGATAEEQFRLCRLRNDLLTARALAASALERAETRGCHVRSDCPERLHQPYRVLTRLDSAGHISTERVKLNP